jgi:RNA polymerase sigma-70 factor (ECF subfamily)
MLDTHDDDAVLMGRIRDGDHGAVESLVRRYQNELVGFFYNQCWDQGIAEELAQDTFVNLYRARERWVPTAKVRTYLYRIAHNLWIDHSRRRRRLVSLDQEDEDGGSLVDGLAAPRDASVQGDPGRNERIRDRVQDALSRLGAGHREVFLLANNQAMRYHEISEVLGIPEGTVKSRMHHAVRVLREALADLVEEMQP